MTDLQNMLLSMNEVSRAGLQSGLEIGRREGEEKVRLLVSVLEQIAEEAEDRQDVIDGADGPRPDAWMCVAQMCREALDKVR